MDLQVKDDKGGPSESGFYCEVCDCIVKDSLNYLDHVNGRRHNRNLGISLKKFTDSTLEEVKEMLNLKRREREERLERGDDEERDDMEQGGVMEDEGEEEEEEETEEDRERLRQLRREKKKRQKARRAGKM